MTSLQAEGSPEGIECFRKRAALRVRARVRTPAADRHTRAIGARVRFGLMNFPTDYGIAPAELGRAAEDAGFEALFFAEHTHIPVSRETPYAGGGELPESTGTRTTRSWRWRRSPQAHGAAAARHRHLPDHRARPDHHGEGGRVARPALRRALRVRHRRRLEPRGDAQPRHRPEAAVLDHARARAGDEGDLDAGRGGVPRRVRRLRPDLVVAEAGPAAASAGDRRRRSARRCSTACSTTATSGCRTGVEPAELKPRIAELRERAGRHVPVTYYGAGPTDAFVEALADAGVDRALLQLPAPPPTRCCRWWSGMPSSPPATAEERLAHGARRPARDGDGGRPPARRAGVLRTRGRADLHGGRRQAEVHPRAASGWRTCAPPAGRACSSTTTRRTGRSCGGSASTAPAEVHRLETRRSTRWPRKYEQYRAARPAGPVIAITPERWRSWIPFET